jgi:hypothetical protein
LTSAEHSNRQFVLAALLGIITGVDVFVTRLYVIYGPGETNRPFRLDSLVLVWSIPSIWLIATILAIYSALALRGGAQPRTRLHLLPLWALAAGFLACFILRWAILSAR